MEGSRSTIESPAGAFAPTQGQAEATALRLLQQATALLRSPAPLGELLTELMRMVAASARARGVSIAFLEQTGRLVPGLALNLSQAYLEASTGARVGLGACGQAIERGAPVVAELHRDPLLASAGALARPLGIVAVVATPLLPVAHNGASLGALAIHLDRPHSAEDLERGRTFAGLVAAILEHKQAEATALRRAADEEAKQQRQEFLASVAHDLRNPLGAIISSAALLERGLAGDAERPRKQVAVILRSAHQMEHLITDLLDLSQMDTGKFRLRRQRHPVPELVKDAIEDVQAQALEQHIALEVELAPEVAMLHCDLERLQQVLANLLGNAVKFTPEGGFIRVAAKVKGDAVEFTVADSGIGIPREQLERIFDRYWQARHGTRHGVGLGLGLSIVRGIIEAHGGHIRVESAPGAGTTFSFTVPLRGVDSRHDTLDDLAEFFDLPVATVRVLLENLERGEFGAGSTPEIGLIPVCPGARHAGAQATLIRAAPGATFPYHMHSGDEHVLVFQGGFRSSDGSELWAGERAVFAEGTGHSNLVLSDEACLCAVLIMPPRAEPPACRA